MRRDGTRLGFRPTRDADVEGEEIFVMRSMSLATLLAMLGPPKVQRITPGRISFLIYEVTEGEAVIVIRPTHDGHLDGGMVFHRPNPLHRNP